MIWVESWLAPSELWHFKLSKPCARYAALRGSAAQLVNFAGVLEGHKAAMDDWVPTERVEALRRLAAENGLQSRVGAQFEVVRDDTELTEVVGRETLTTTRARGYPLAERIPGASAHVFLGRDRTTVEEAQRAGWYPLVIEGRATSKPWIDHYWFGRALGYPECCLRAFARNNNWAIDNTPYQAYRATATPHWLCNSLMRLTGLPYASHLPCAYDCPATISEATALRGALAEHAPKFVPAVDSLLSRPYLVLSEWEAFAFEGTVAAAGDNGKVVRIDYSRVSIAPSNRPNTRLLGWLQAGDAVEIYDDLVVVMRGDQVVAVERCTIDGFAPRVPVILDFSPKHAQQDEGGLSWSSPDHH